MTFILVARHSEGQQTGTPGASGEAIMISFVASAVIALILNRMARCMNLNAQLSHNSPPLFGPICSAKEHTSRSSLVMRCQRKKESKRLMEKIQVISDKPLCLNYFIPMAVCLPVYFRNSRHQARAELLQSLMRLWLLRELQLNAL